MTVTSEVTYHYVKGQGWIPSPRGRTAAETVNLTWDQLRTGDAVFVLERGRTRIARVHKMEEPLKLEPVDSGAWLHSPSGVPPYRINNFGAIGYYGKQDSAWTRLVGVSFPGGKDYEV